MNAYNELYLDDAMANLGEMCIRDSPKSLYPKYTQEKGLPYTLPGILQFEIKDESIFEIKEVEGTYKDGGLGGGNTYPAMKYYLCLLYTSRCV